MRWLILLLLLGACTTLSPGAEDDPLSLTYQDLHRYEAVRNYTYRASIANLTVTVTTIVEQADGRWKLTNTLDDYTSIMYIDSGTEGCLQVSDGQCPVQGVNSERAASTVPVFAGEEHIAVPAGTFSARRYVVNEDSYWVARDVPVPVRYEGELFSMELVDWE